MTRQLLHPWRKTCTSSGNLDIVELLQPPLEQDGYPVIVAHSGEKGLAEAQRRKPGLIVLDLMLPGLDDLEVCKA